MLEIEDAKADLTNTVKSIVQRGRDSGKGLHSTEESKHASEQPRILSAKPVLEDKDMKEAKDSSSPTAGEGKEENKDSPNEDESSEEERSSFYEEIFYDAVSEIKSPEKVPFLEKRSRRDKKLSLTSRRSARPCLRNGMHDRR